MINYNLYILMLYEITTIERINYYSFINYPLCTGLYLSIYLMVLANVVLFDKANDFDRLWS